MPETIRLISGTANPQFTQAICDALLAQSVKARVIDADIGNFSDGETRVQIRETVRGYDIYVVQPTCPPVNDNLIELCAILDALKRASANSKTAVIPYYGYARQEKKGMPRVPISAKMVAQFIELAGADRVIAMDLHAAAIQGFFEVPVDNLTASPVFATYFRETLPRIKNVVIVSPDIGGTARARILAEALGVPLAIIEKRRHETTGAVEVFRVIGEVKNRTAVLFDDIVSSGGTLIDGAKLLLRSGAKEVLAGATHGVFSGTAIEQLKSSCLKQVVVSDTVTPKKRTGAKIQRISVAGIFADTIRRIQEKRSVSDIFHSSESP